MTGDLFAQNLDLFANEPAPVCAPPVAAPAPLPTVEEPIAMAAATADASTTEAECTTPEYPMQHIGVNRWSYKGEILTYDSRKETVAGRGRWASIEGIGKPEVRGDSHRDICAAIDARCAS